MSSVPKLRFKEFSGEWKAYKLDDLTDRIIVGIATSTTEYYTENTIDSVPLIRNQNIKNGYFDDSDMEYISKKFDETNKNKRVREGDIIIVRTGSNVGLTCVVPPQYKNAQTFTTLIVSPKKNHLSSNFLNQTMHTDNKSSAATRLVTGGGKGNLNSTALKTYPMLCPSLDEQEKISSFLTSVDTKIEQLRKKEELLQQYKKSVMQKIFNQEIRFKADDGSDFCDWEEKKLGDLLKETKDKSTSSNQYEVLSSTKDTVVLQSEYFNREIASSDNTGYKILRINQLVFSPQNLWLGNINVNTKYDIGIVSPSYKIYDFKSKLALVSYFKYFLKTPKMMYEYGQASEQGASVVRRSLNIDLFNDIRVSTPCLDEQLKIATFLSSIDTKIEQVQKQLDSTKQFKKALLQQMFV